MDKIPLARLTPFSDVCYFATQGLIHFRSGDSVLGREWYQQALESTKKPELQDERAKVLIHLAREEVLAGFDKAVSTLKETIDACKGRRDADVRGILERLQSVLVERNEASLAPILSGIADLTKVSKPVLPTKWQSPK